MLHITKRLVNTVEYVLELFKMDLIDLPEATEKMIEQIEREQKIQLDLKPSVDFIRHVTAEHLGLDELDVISQSRKREFTEARQIAMYLCNELCDRRAIFGVSLKAIGAGFGGRDHSTVLYAIDTVNDLIDTDQRFKDTVLIIRKKIVAQFNN